ncbi:hypothetical protein PUNSTDRAFT_120050 [Punctularia strigosozonata HHB-11173 SS5]|uniref:uncharacterized protein n=1 Tax=Punctularia strigosozonata (strain HHB-11173) TaxID=741275 RepID=UPI00044162D6|nr:uncharacterized protein PUNSTDRAFT_120050 [Punctularia strigosozonata HHB-11173 SS5]EIN09627.1 hypothetical protein PUNSTDRAFT_120050 [Punctularia strigosozonata HHB-11173 SS5]
MLRKPRKSPASANTPVDQLPPRPLGNPSGTQSQLARTTVSQTLSVALTKLPSGRSSADTTAAIPWSSAAVQPRSTAEQYWAARALTAETLLTAQAAHQRDMKAMTWSEDMKRTRDIAALHARNDARQQKLERVVVALVITVLSMACAIVYLLTYRQPAAQPKARFTFHFPSHFSIPVLSPFTSVVENETSAIGSKLLIAGFALLCLLAYAMFTQWISRRVNR